MSDTNAPIPHYRFNIILQKANELCNDVKSLGSSLLSALEKRDAEALALLRSRHEMSLMEVVRHVKELQVEEAKISLEGLGKNLEMAQSRLKHYCNLLSAAEQIALPVSSQQSQAQRLLSAFSEFSNTFEPRDLLGSRAAKLVEPYAQESLKILQETLSLPTQQTENEEKVTLPLSSFEKKQLTELKYANEKQKKAMDFESLAQVLALIPDFTLGLEGLTSSPVIEASIGGTLLSTAARLQASNFTYEASDHSYRANLHSILAGYQRRAEEWLHQAELVLKEIEQIAKQIEAAGLRLAITTREIKNHDLQVKNTQEVDEYLRDKYTNQELYDWMVGQISGLYFQSYQLAYDVAKRAERTYRFELGVTESNFIQFGYWDSLKKGLLSGEKLQYDLRRLEINYLELNRREFELTKYVSLVLHSPMALITLKQTGRCEFELPEELFDADYPGHFMRRIKSVSITVPCVTGPYTNVNCTLTLLKNSVRKTQSSSDPYSRDDTSGADLRFADNLVAIQSIVTSSANNESGVFEVNLRDERYLPFEGAGAISQWRIDLPKECNAFDFDTLSDVVLHLKYTAREGGDSLKGAAKEAMQATIAVAGTTPLARLFSAKHEFPTDWHRFMHPADPAPGEDIVQKLPLALTQERFPFQLRGRKLQVDKMHLFLKLKEEFTYKEDGTAKEKFTYDDDKPLALVLKEDGNALPVSQFLKGGSPISDLPYAEPLKGQSGKLGQWPLEVKEDEVKKIDASLQQKVKINGQDHVRLHPDAIEDVWIVCEYQVLK